MIRCEYGGDGGLGVGKVGCPLRTRPREGFEDVSCVGDAAWTDMGDIAADEAVGGGEPLVVRLTGTEFGVC